MDVSDCSCVWYAAPSPQIICLQTHPDIWELNATSATFCVTHTTSEQVLIDHVLMCAP